MKQLNDELSELRYFKCMSLEETNVLIFWYFCVMWRRDSSGLSPKHDVDPTVPKYLEQWFCPDLGRYIFGILFMAIIFCSNIY